MLVVLCAVYLRRLSYELFLRTHQLLAAGMWLALWYHISNTNSLVKWYVLGVSGASGALPTFQLLQILIRNRFFYHGTARVHVQRMGVSTLLHLRSPIVVNYQAGQYVNLYMPGIGIRSAFESHPFTVVAATREATGQDCQLMVKPARGWSRRLLECAERSHAGHSKSYVAFFSGPHGRTISMNEYGTVVLVASRWGIMAQLPYLEYLIRSSHNSCTNVQKAYLIWQLDHLGGSTNPIGMKEPVMTAQQIKASQSENF